MALKFSGILIRCPAPVEYVVFFSLLHEIIGLGRRLQKKSTIFTVSEGVCCKHVPCCVDLEHLWGFSTMNVSPHLFCGRQAGEREDRKGRHKRIV